jgi:hypothetical protein
MGALRDQRGITHRLRTRTRIGRASDNDIVVPESTASGLHATIEWRGGFSWELKDLGSKNGTFVDGRRVETGAWERLAATTELAFGDARETWVVVDLKRPEAEAYCRETGEIRSSKDRILTLSDDPNDWVDVVEDAPGSWMLEMRGRCDALVDQQVVAIGGRTWVLTLPTAEPQTAPLPSPETQRPVDVRFMFRVSADTEHVELSVRHGAETWTSTRACTHALLRLAEARLRDREAGGHPDEHGWLYSDDLCTLAGYENDARLNVEIHRARRALASIGLPNAQAIIQRRRGTRQLRIGTSVLEIEFLGATAV